MQPEKFGRYEVQAEIGDGAMGRVYRAFDPLVRRQVAIKTVKSEHLTRDSAPEYLRRFRREAQAAGGLSHPNIVNIFDVGEDYFVMEFLEGVTLQDRLKDGPLGATEALRILVPVAAALDYAHKQGIIHRDIKPANIMVLPDGRPKLMDFGVAHLEATVMTQAGQFLGSPSYMAPEQIMGGEVTSKADLFSLAVVAYETITGHKPFPGESITSIIYRVMNEEPPSPRHWNFDLPAPYDDIFRRSLAKDPLTRYPTATAFLNALDLKELDTALSGVADEGRPTETDPGPVETRGENEGPKPPAPNVFEHQTHALGKSPFTPATATGLPKWLPWAAGLLVVAGVTALLLLRQGSAPSDGSGASLGGGLQIETVPAGAAVLLDGQAAGQSPLSLKDVPPGAHKVRVTQDGFAPAELTLEVVAGTNPPPLRFELQPVSARARIDSDPSGATVRMDGKNVGVTPIESLWVDPGNRDIRIEKKGFKPYAQRLDAKAGGSLKVDARLEPAGTKAVVVAPPTPTPEPPLVEGMLVEMGPEVTPPRRISGDSARYPEAASRLKLLGTVTIDMVITEKGEPTDLRVTESAGEALDRAVLEAVRTWKFTPALKRGIKVRVHWQARQTFKSAS